MSGRGWLVALALLPGLAVAQSRDESRLDGNAARGVEGVASINLAAGAGNAQANVRALALGPDALATALAAQHVDAAAGDRSRDARAVISGSAFGDATGLLGINQVAGAANAQANVLAVGPVTLAGLFQQVDNAALAATAAPPADAAAAPAVPAAREARIDAGALAAPTGVVQINQTAGVGNASANVIVLQLPGGTP